ncbi:ATP-binding protein [Limosilactobacillus gorillae]|jgi:carbamoyl-phosphate synthase large subunit|uniref:ATP-binding protein n=1 Tax=Limosilactobacillus gorillae TaxID=1450649 RepID=UPI000A5A3125|nr:ATP-grasp domain-containing protein [Limosilactobacillus gorillae]
MTAVLIIGAGADDLQHGGELDQATLEIAVALKKHDLETVLIDDNPFSFTLDEQEVIDHAILAPLEVEQVVELIEKYAPTMIIPTLGSRKAFELVQAVSETGIIQERGIHFCGVPEATIRQVNNPVLMSQTLKQLGAPTKMIKTVSDYHGAVELVDQVGYPVIVRAALPKKQAPRRIVHDPRELQQAVSAAIQESRASQVMVQQSLAGLKEIEVLVMRDASGTMMNLAMVENLDPIGIHAGDSIAVTPAQTLMDREIQDIRDVAFAITRRLRIVGINHVQFALDQEHQRFYVIKNSPYFDRLASFVEAATGYPVATVCGHLYAGQLLSNIKLGHDYPRHLALTEPVMDRTAVRLPTFPIESLPGQRWELRTEKQSVGSVIGVGRSFLEAIIKGSAAYYTPTNERLLKEIAAFSDERLDERLIHPCPHRLLTLLEALLRGYSSDELTELTKIDRYYFDQLKRGTTLVKRLQEKPGSLELLKQAKYWGLSDDQIAQSWKISVKKVAALREENQFHRVFKEVDPSAGEFDVHTNHFYATFEVENESSVIRGSRALIVGDGPRKLGNSTANDYVLGMVARELRRHQFRVVSHINNPNSLLLTRHLSDKVYLEPHTAEAVAAIARLEQPDYAFIPVGKQNLKSAINAVSPATKVVIIEAMQTPQNFVSSIPTLEFNALFDGQVVYQLGVTGELKDQGVGKYQTLAKRYPAHLEKGLATKVTTISDQVISQQTTPGLYQVLYQVDRLAEGIHEEVQPLTAPDVAFMTKALGLNLTAIWVRLMIGNFSGQFLVKASHVNTSYPDVIYRAHFPYADYHLTNQKSRPATVIGAQIERA